MLTFPALPCNSSSFLNFLHFRRRLQIDRLRDKWIQLEATWLFWNNAEEDARLSLFCSLSYTLDGRPVYIILRLPMVGHRCGGSLLYSSPCLAEISYSFYFLQTLSLYFHSTLMDRGAKTLDRSPDFGNKKALEISQKRMLNLLGLFVVKLHGTLSNEWWQTCLGILYG